MIQGARWFKVVSGAYANRADADSLLVGLRRQNVLEAGRGSVVRVPFAFLIDSLSPATAVPAMVADVRGSWPAGVRAAPGEWKRVAAVGRVRDRSSKHPLYAESLRASGITPVLVYRKGRAF